jgi:hypothetical protein
VNDSTIGKRFAKSIANFTISDLRLILLAFAGLLRRQRIGNGKIPFEALESGGRIFLWRMAEALGAAEMIPSHPFIVRRPSVALLIYGPRPLALT